VVRFAHTIYPYSLEEATKKSAKNKNQQFRRIIMAAEQSLFFSGVSLDSSKISLYQQTSHQEFVRDDVFICQSIDPYQRIVNANKIMSSGESLFFNDKTMNSKK
jgi:hypothetical protein